MSILISRDMGVRSRPYKVSHGAILVVDDSLTNMEQKLEVFRPVGETAVLERALTRLSAAAAGDNLLRKRLLHDPRALLASHGYSFAPSVRIDVHEERPGSFHLLLPLGDVDENDYVPITLQVLERARRDREFAADLRKQPRRVLESAFGFRLASTVEIAVHQNAPGHLHVILPWEMTAGELSDAELEMVAGGTSHPFRLFPRPK